MIDKPGLLSGGCPHRLAAVTRHNICGVVSVVPVTRDRPAEGGPL
jgi:hypothetical protein